MPEEGFRYRRPNGCLFSHSIMDDALSHSEGHSLGQTRIHCQKLGVLIMLSDVETIVFI